MANITKLKFAALDISGKNYLSWVFDADIHLVSKDLGETIKEGNKESLHDRAKALIFLRHHLYDGLKIEYLTQKDPQVRCKKLTERFDHQRTIVFPKARYEWMHLRLQNFKTQQYHEHGFKKYSELISCLLVAEQNNELLMKNQWLRPIGSVPLPKTNGTALSETNAISRKGHGRGRGRGRGCGHGFGRGRGCARGVNDGRNNQ
ncbi:uncharacterized protein LOC111404499 [Olea europaea var. sylvestris]|uniref:uncharacterized protein LOC111404499 n=1 Tax=Olea europaea var. sylvestris TaxID=158386 RepID=UPI000C1CE59B|nr:uncharacterized protein LOC111404499 [Olea europaea var. sylvestris]